MGGGAMLGSSTNEEFEVQTLVSFYSLQPYYEEKLNDLLTN